MKLWHDNTGARLGNNVVLRLSDARLRASKVEPVGGFDLNGLDLVLTLPLIDSPPTTITFSSDGMSLDEVVDEINAIIGPAGTDVGLARSSDGALEILAKRAVGRNYSFLSIAINSSPATSILGFYPRALWVDAGVLSTSGDLESTPFGGRSNQNPDDSTFIGPESLNEGGINRALVSLGLSNDALMSMLTTPRPILQSGGSPLGTGSQDIELTSGICGTKIFVGFPSIYVAKYFQVRDADGLPVFDSNGDPITVQYVTTGQCVGSPPVDALAFGDGGNILEGDIRLLIPMDGNNQNTVTEVRGKCQLVCEGVDFGSGDSVYSDLLARIESSLAEPNNNGYWRIAGLYGDMIEVRLPAALPEDPALTLKPWLTTDATSHGTVAIYTDGNFFPTRLVENGEAHVHLSAAIPAGVTAYLYYFGPQSYFEATFLGNLNDDVENLLGTDLSAILQAIRRMKGTESGVIGPNGALTEDPWGDEAHPVSLEDLHSARSLAGAYTGQSRDQTKPAGNYVATQGDGVHIETNSYALSGLTPVGSPLTDGVISIIHGRAYFDSASEPFTPDNAGDMIQLDEAGAYGQHVRCKIIRYVSPSQVELGPDIVGKLTVGEEAVDVHFQIYEGEHYYPLSGSAGLIMQVDAGSAGFGRLNVYQGTTSITPVAHLRLRTSLAGKSYLDDKAQLEAPNTVRFTTAAIDLGDDADILQPGEGIGDFVYIQGSATPYVDGWYRVSLAQGDYLQIKTLSGDVPLGIVNEAANEGLRAFYFSSEMVEYHNSAGEYDTDLNPRQSQLKARSFRAYPGSTGFGVEVITNLAAAGSQGALLVREYEAAAAWDATTYGIEITGSDEITFDPETVLSSFKEYGTIIRLVGGATPGTDGVYLVKTVEEDPGAGGPPYSKITVICLNGDAPDLQIGDEPDIYKVDIDSLISATGSVVVRWKSDELPPIIISSGRGNGDELYMAVKKADDLGTSVFDTKTPFTLFWDDSEHRISLFCQYVQVEDLHATNNISAEGDVSADGNVSAGGHVEAGGGNVYGTGEFQYADARDQTERIPIGLAVSDVYDDTITTYSPAWVLNPVTGKWVPKRTTGYEVGTTLSIPVRVPEGASLVSVSVLLNYLDTAGAADTVFLLVLRSRIYVGSGPSDTVSALDSVEKTYSGETDGMEWVTLTPANPVAGDPNREFWINVSMKSCESGNLPSNTVSGAKSLLRVSYVRS